MSDKVFKALGDPTRRQILKLLNEGDKTAGDISDKFAITSATMSHHFNVLKDADLVCVQRNGQKMVYSLNTTVFQDVLTLLMDVFGQKAEADKT